MNSDDEDDDPFNLSAGSSDDDNCGGDGGAATADEQEDGGTATYYRTRQEEVVVGGGGGAGLNRPTALVIQPLTAADAQIRGAFARPAPLHLHQALDPLGSPPGSTRSTARGRGFSPMSGGMAARLTRLSPVGSIGQAAALAQRAQAQQKPASEENKERTEAFIDRDVRAFRDELDARLGGRREIGRSIGRDAVAQIAELQCRYVSNLENSVRAALEHVNKRRPGADIDLGGIVERLVEETDVIQAEVCKLSWQAIDGKVEGMAAEDTSLLDLATERMQLSLEQLASSHTKHQRWMQHAFDAKVHSMRDSHHKAKGREIAGHRAYAAQEREKLKEEFEAGVEKLVEQSRNEADRLRENLKRVRNDLKLDHMAHVKQLSIDHEADKKRVVQKYKEQLEEVQRELSATKKKFRSEMAMVKRQHGAEIAELRAQIDRITAEYDATRLDYEKLKLAHQESAGQLSKMKAAMEEATAELVVLQKECKAKRVLEKKVEELESKQLDFQAKLEKQMQQLSQAKKKLSHAEQQVQDLQFSNKDLSNQRAALEGKLGKAKRARQQLQDRVDALSSELDVQKRRGSAAQHDAEEAKQVEEAVLANALENDLQLEALSMKNKNLEERLAKLLAERHAAPDAGGGGGGGGG